MTKHNFWSISIVFTLFALLFTPMIVAGSLYFPYVTGKVFAFRAIISLSLIAWLFLVLNRPEFMPKKSRVLGVSALFVAWLAVANFAGVDATSSFFSNFERMEGWFTHLYLFVYLVIISSVFRTDRIWNWFLGTSVVIANIISIVAAFDKELRTSAFLGNSTYVAVYILFNLFFGVLLAYRLYKSQTREMALKYAGLSCLAASTLLFVYIILRTQTRGTAIALVVSSLLFLVLMVFSHWKNKIIRFTSLGLLTLVVVGAGMFWINRDSSFIQNNPLLARIATISATEGTGKARVMNWSIALEGIKENPVMGWGQENYMYVFPAFYNPDMYGQEPWFDRTHNAFLDWTIQGGIVALLLYLALFGSALVAIYKSTSLTSIEKNILVSMFAGYVIHNLFVFDNYSSYLMFFTALGLVVHHQHQSNLARPDNLRVSQAIVATLVILALFAGYKVIVKPYMVAHQLISTVKSQNPKEVLDAYVKMFEKDTLGNFEVTTRFLSEAPRYMKIEDADFRQMYMDAAIRMGEQSILDAPRSVRGLEFYGTFLLQTGNPKEAIVILERAREISPNRQNNLYVLGFSYVTEKQYDKALEIFKHAYEVAPENTKARNYYGAALLLVNDPKGNEYLKDYSPDDTFLLSVFNSAGRYNDVAIMLEKQVALQPENYQLQVSLAVAYFKAGNKAKSVEIIRAVMAKVPAFRAQGEYFIKEVQAGRNPTK